MLQVDLTKSEPELTRIISTYCSSFGVVASVKIHHNPKAFALVEMSTHQEALKLAAHFGRTAFGCCVLVYLMP
jgi:hypothetical protein